MIVVYRQEVNVNWRKVKQIIIGYLSMTDDNNLINIDNKSITVDKKSKAIDNKSVTIDYRPKISGKITILNLIQDINPYLTVISKRSQTSMINDPTSTAIDCKLINIDSMSMTTKNNFPRVKEYGQ